MNLGQEHAMFTYKNPFLLLGVLCVFAPLRDKKRVKVKLGFPGV
jgi:hypothetical protein